MTSDDIVLVTEEQLVVTIPVLNSGGRPHPFASHFFCFTDLLQQLSLLLQELLIFLHHCLNAFFLLLTTAQSRRKKKYIKEYVNIPHVLCYTVRGLHVCSKCVCDLVRETGCQQQVILQFLYGAISLGCCLDEHLLGLSQLDLVLTLLFIVLPALKQ